MEMFNELYYYIIIIHFLSPIMITGIVLYKLTGIINDAIGAVTTLIYLFINLIEFLCLCLFADMITDKVLFGISLTLDSDVLFNIVSLGERSDVRDLQYRVGGVAEKLETIENDDGAFFETNYIARWANDRLDTRILCEGIICKITIFQEN